LPEPAATTFRTWRDKLGDLRMAYRAITDDLVQARLERERIRIDLSRVKESIEVRSDAERDQHPAVVDRKQKVERRDVEVQRLQQRADVLSELSGLSPVAVVASASGIATASSSNPRPGMHSTTPSARRICGDR
jgi:chromosome segregation ATPase